MKITYPIGKAQSHFPRMVRETANGTIAITRHDETVAYLISQERMEAIVETMEILANPEAMAALKQYGKGRMKFHPVEAADADR